MDIVNYKLTHGAGGESRNQKLTAEENLILLPVKQVMNAAVNHDWLSKNNSSNSHKYLYFHSIFNN
jgi:hypothetical protein